MDGPEVTVSDPSRPSVPADLLEARGPWRPSRRLTQVAAVALVLVALIAAASRVVDSRSPGQGADRGLAGVRLSTQVGGVSLVDGTFSTPIVVLGPPGVEIIGATVAGGWSLSSDLQAGPNSLATLEVYRPVDCDRATVPEPVVSVVLAAGVQHRSLQLALPPVGPDYDGVAGPLCGRADDAMVVGSTGEQVRRVGDHLEATLRLTNDSNHPVRVLGVSSEGLSVRVVDRLPLVLPARQYGRRFGPLPVMPLRLILTLTQCAGAAGQVLAGTVTGSTGFELQLGHGGLSLRSDRLRDLQRQLVAERCRHR